jgi:pectinesterase
MKDKLTLFFALISLPILAQNLSGITGKKDTSFNNNAALRWSAKDFPDAKIAEYKSKNVIEYLDINYCTVNGYDLAIDVFTPKKRSLKARPALMIIHGGGWRTGDKTQHHALARKLASKGYVVFTPAYRLSTMALFPAAVKDINTAIKWVKLHAVEYGIDKDKIALAGYSAGGQMAAFIGTTADATYYQPAECDNSENTIVKAVIDLDGILAYLHPESGEGDDSKSISAATHYFGYNKFQNPDLWIEASALRHVSPSSPPILFINSLDGRMHAGRDDYIQKLTEYGIYSEVHTFDAPHVFPLMDLWFDDTVKLMDGFLKKQFK